MSTVYLAFDRKLGRHVALKVLRGDMFVEPERFAQEIHVTAKLQHPHILPLLDADEVDGRAYYVMPFVDGESLRDRLTREGSLPLVAAVRLAREIAGALGYAHQRDIVHRDIKPENILLSDGHALVADFGIARAAAGTAGADASITQPGLAVGTPAYMSPEQALGDPVDGRSDLYSLGCMLYEMLCARLPFAGSSGYGQLAAKMSGGYTPITSVRTDVPDAVDQLLRRLLSRNPDDRPARASDLVAALEAAVQGTVLTPLPRVVELPANSVAVLAFANMSPNADDEHLAEGISEAIMHGLTKVPGLRVIARTSAFALKGSGLDVRDIAVRLRVRRLVEGSVRRAGSRLRVTAKLIDGESALELWSERFDRDVDDVFAVEDELAGAVAAQLKALLLGESGDRLPTRQAQAAPTANMEAYEQYLLGRYHWGQRTASSIEKSVDHLKMAVRLDSQFALAFSALAEAYATMGLYGMAAPHEVAPLAREAANRALAITPDAAGALSARACVRACFSWEWEESERDFRAAIAADPQYPTAYQWYASTVLVPQRRFAEAQEQLARAADLDPLSLSVLVSRAAAAYYARDFAGAVHWAREALAIDAHFAMGHFFLGLALEQTGAPQEAEEALSRVVRLSESVEALAALGAAQTHRGDLVAADQTRQMLQRRTERSYVSPVLLAQMAARAGDEAGALWQLRRAMDVRASDLIWVGVRPVFDALRTHAAFQSAMAELRLPLDG
jgi:serine/threonine-protein kinase